MKGQKLYSRRGFDYLVFSVGGLALPGWPSALRLVSPQANSQCLNFTDVTSSRRPEASRSLLSRSTTSIRRRCVAPKTSTGWQDCYGTSE